MGVCVSTLVYSGVMPNESVSQSGATPGYKNAVRTYVHRLSVFISSQSNHWHADDDAGVAPCGHLHLNSNRGATLMNKHRHSEISYTPMATTSAILSHLMSQLDRLP